jgi:hypothetical protein
VTSFNALPAICLCRFFMWEVFFFGTARSKPSHISRNTSETEANAARGNASGDENAAGASIRRITGVESSGWRANCAGGKRCSIDCNGRSLAAIAAAIVQMFNGLDLDLDEALPSLLCTVDGLVL